MKILIISIGTRGDIEPFLAIAEILKERGHNVICVFPEQFRNLAEDSKNNFIPLSPKLIELIESKDVKVTMGGRRSILKKIKNFIRIYRQSNPIINEIFLQEQEIIINENPDKIVSHITAVYPIVHEIKNPNSSILISTLPCILHPVKEYPSIGFKSNYGPFFNKITYKISNFLLLRIILHTTKDFRKSLKITPKDVKNTLFSKKISYMVSPTIFSRPKSWPENARIVGYHERDKSMNWKSDENLNLFLEKHNKIMFITFGSAINPKPEKNTKIFLDILENNGIPAIINIAGGGLNKPKIYDKELIHFIPTIPYDWIFPKVYCVIHHGGAGTTHMATKYGCPSLIIPHIVDQYLWDTLLKDLGIGPKGIPIKKLNRKKLEPKVLDLFHNANYKTKALELSEKMKNEDFTSALYESIVR